MATLLCTLTSAAATVLFAYLIWRGFEDGDEPGDVRVSVVSIRRSPTGDSAGGWIELDVANPGRTSALVGLRLHRGPFGWRRHLPAKRRYVGQRQRQRSLADQQVGVVAAGETGTFWLRSVRDPAAEVVLALVGTCGRVRLHTLPTVSAADLTCWDEQPLVLEFSR